jgi:hypothetical protein
MSAHYLHILCTQNVFELLLIDIQKAYWKPIYKLADRLCHIGGYKPRKITMVQIEKYLKNLTESKYKTLHQKEFVYEAHDIEKNLSQYISDNCIVVNIPLHELINLVSINLARSIVLKHICDIGVWSTKAQIEMHVKSHVCELACKEYVTVFSIVCNSVDRANDRRKEWNQAMSAEQLQSQRSQTAARVRTLREHKKDTQFPPVPLSKHSTSLIVASACKKLTPSYIEESGCAVCGMLAPTRELSRLSAVKNYLGILKAPGVTRVERAKSADKIREYPTAIDHSCTQICNPCRASVRTGKMPKYALAKGIWLGQVPQELSSLRYIEKMLVARVRHNQCTIKIASGMHKMKANAIAYQSPIPKIYNMLPPPKEDIEDVLAIMFTGPCKPTSLDFRRTPFLIRHNHVMQALEWLKLNHSDYEDIQISEKNLTQYPEDMPPVAVMFKQMDHNKTPEGTSVFDMDEEDGTADGECSFTVHGLTGDQLDTMSINTLKAKALQHLNKGSKFLAIGHNDQPESLLNYILRCSLGFSHMVLVVLGQSHHCQKRSTRKGF